MYTVINLQLRYFKTIWNQIWRRKLWSRYLTRNLSKQLSQMISRKLLKSWRSTSFKRCWCSKMCLRQQILPTRSTMSSPNSTLRIVRTKTHSLLQLVSKLVVWSFIWAISSSIKTLFRMQRPLGMKSKTVSTCYRRLHPCHSKTISQWWTEWPDIQQIYLHYLRGLFNDLNLALLIVFKESALVKDGG